MENLIDTTILQEKHRTLKRGDVTAICASLNITRQTYYNVLQGKKIGLSTLAAVCAKLGVELSEVFRVESGA